MALTKQVFDCSTGTMQTVAMTPAEEAAFNASRVVVPDTITNAQCRQQLIAMGLFAEINAAIQAGGGNTLVKWEYANIVERSDGVIAALATQFGKTSADIDAFFIAANAL